VPLTQSFSVLHLSALNDLAPGGISVVMSRRFKQGVWLACWVSGFGAGRHLYLCHTLWPFALTCDLCFQSTCVLDRLLLPINMCSQSTCASNQLLLAISMCSLDMCCQLTGALDRLDINRLIVNPGVCLLVAWRPIRAHLAQPLCTTVVM
jgi:hypothetical protein